jgi:putative hemolysin
MTTLTLVVILSLVVAWLTAAATAVRSVSRIWLRHWAERQLTGGAVAELYLDRPQRLLLAAGTGIASIVFALGALLGLREEGFALVEYLLISMLSLLVVGQLVPRAIARRWASPLVPLLMPALRVLDWLFTPLLAVAGRFARAAHPRLASTNTPAEDARESLEDLLREGELEGVGEASESAIISGVVEFGEKTVGEVMTARSEVVAVERRVPASEIIRLVAQSKYSRIPVYDGDIDHVAGIIHSFDILAHPDAPVTALRKMSSVAPETPCHDVMKRMLRERVHLAIVRGTDGITLGLVTLEDLVEELVGEISDEHDEPNSTPAT